MNSEMIYTFTTWVIPLVLCAIIHEVSHGYMALWLGDKTAERSGRLTLNPVSHIDPIGSVLLPITMVLMNSPFLFGWAKPVPVNFMALKNPKRDMALVALAGPLSNVLLGVVFLLIGKFLLTILDPYTQFYAWCVQNLHNGIVFTLVLAVFNMLPILPLDGGRVVYSCLPEKYAYEYAKTERYGMFILLGLMIFPQIIGINIIGWILGFFVPLLYNMISVVI